MGRNRHRRGLLLVAAILIVIALVLLLLPHVHAGNTAVCLILFTTLFIDILPPLYLLSRMAYLNHGQIPDSPFLPTPFQRPPPFRHA